jgi:hypothetical protein
MKISFLFPDNVVDLEIELVDNPGIKSWATHFKNGLASRAHFQYYYKLWNYDPVVLKDHLSICQDQVSKLDSHGYTYNGPFPSSVDGINRDFTNQLHRFFTHTQQLVNVVLWPELSAERHAAKKYEITSWLQELNDQVHLIELYLRPIPEMSFLESFGEIYLSDDPAYTNADWWNLATEHRQYHSAEHADVIFGPQILGKTLLRSYLDGDNPNDWDTSGHYLNLGSLLIQTGPIYRQEIYNSEDFKNWLSKWGMTAENTYYDYPVGNVKNKELLSALVNRLKNNRKPIDIRYEL